MESDWTDYAFAIYFAPHLPEFLTPLTTSEFRTLFEGCQVFIMEYAEQWLRNEPDKEELYNRLSQGLIDTVPSRGRELTPFSRQLQSMIRGSGKQVVLERSPTEYVVDRISDVVNRLRRDGLDEALRIYISNYEALANPMTERDRAIVENVLRPQLKNDSKLLMFRGAAHYRSMQHLLRKHSIVARCIRYEQNPPLSERVLGSLTMGETVPAIDFLRLLHADLNRRGSNYDALVRSQAETETMTEEEIRAKYRA